MPLRGCERPAAPLQQPDLSHGDVDDLCSTPTCRTGPPARVQEDVSQGVQAALQRGLTPSRDGGKVKTLQGFYFRGQMLGDGRGWLSRNAGAIWLGTRQLAIREKKKTAEVPFLGLEGILSVPLLQSDQFLHLLQTDQVKHPLA